MLLQVLVQVRLMFHDVMSASLQNSLSEYLGLPICLYMVRCGEVVPGRKYSANIVKQLGSKMLFVVG